MTVVVYPAVIATEPEGALSGRFPDLAGEPFSAASQAELIRVAREELTAALQRLERQGESWPEPTPLGSLAPPPGGSVILVDVSVDDTPVRLTISLGERLLKRIDRDAEARSMTRSGYLALGARRLLGEEAMPFGGLGGASGAKLEAEVAALQRRVVDTLGPDSPVGRTLAELDAIALDGLRRLGGEVRSALRRRPPPPPPPPPSSPPPPHTGGTEEPPNT